LSIVFFGCEFDTRRTFTRREQRDPGTPNRECGRAIDVQLRKVGFARHSRYSRPDSSPSLRNLESPDFWRRESLESENPIEQRIG
jgi:hypothetical protein